MKQPNLNKLREEIDSRKSTQNNMQGTPNAAGGAPRDAFLNGLLESLRTGTETQSSTLLKTVENKVTEKEGGSHRIPINELTNNQSTDNNRNNGNGNNGNGNNGNGNNGNGGSDRDEQLFADLKQKQSRTLAESIQGMNGGQQQNAQQYNQQPQQQMNLNEEALLKNIAGTVDNYLMENFGHVVEEAIKSTVLEMYAAEKIKEVLNENTDLIKSVVIDTIRELQLNSKKK
jgi:hypothetical protein